jgi:methylmalonyl-CoA mutase N-terminal domain/subunit
MEQEVLDYFRRIEDLGGVIPAIEKGFFQSEIADAAYRYQREVDDGTRKIVGVNAYQEKKPLRIPLLEMDEDGYKRQVQRLADLRKTRDNGRVGQALDKLRLALEGTENSMPYLMDCVRAYATLGEIIAVMKEVFGLYEESTVI